METHPFHPTGHPHKGDGIKTDKREIYRERDIYIERER
jgi:hypothetical protein